MRSGTIKMIEDKEYEIWHVMPEEAMSIITKLSKVILEPIGQALGKQDIKDVLPSRALMALDTDNEDEDSDSKLDFANAFKSLADRLDESEIKGIMLTMFKYVHIKTDSGRFIPVDINRDFRGRIMHMGRVFIASLEVNFADFLSDTGGRIGSVIKKFQS